METLFNLAKLYENETPTLNQINDIYNKIDTQTLISFILWIEEREKEKIKTAWSLKQLSFFNEGVYVEIFYLVDTKPVQSEYSYLVKVNKELINEFVEFLN